MDQELIHENQVRERERERNSEVWWARGVLGSETAGNKQQKLEQKLEQFGHKLENSLDCWERTPTSNMVRECAGACHLNMHV